MPSNIFIINDQPDPSIPNNFYGIYDIYMHSERYVVPKNDDFICRFCGLKGEKYFQSVSHIIPVFTGNQNLISTFECDQCNKKFSLYETSMSMFGGIRNSISLFNQKKKTPKHKDTKNEFEAQIKDGTLKISVKDKSMRGISIKDNKLKIETTKQSYVPRYVLKCLTKIAISLLNPEDLKLFSKTLNWLAEPKDDITEQVLRYMTLYGNENSPPAKAPVAVLWRKKTTFNAPEFCLIFIYGFHIYQMFLPFCTLDQELNPEFLYHPIEVPHVIQPKHLIEEKETKVGDKVVSKKRMECTLKWMQMNSIEKKIGEEDEFVTNVRPTP